MSGDVLTRRDIARLRMLAPSATCVNVYGATEVPQIAVYYVVPAQHTAGGTKEALPLGPFSFLSGGSTLKLDTIALPLSLFRVPASPNPPRESDVDERYLVLRAASFVPQFVVAAISCTQESHSTVTWRLMYE